MRVCLIAVFLASLVTAGATGCALISLDAYTRGAATEDAGAGLDASMPRDVDADGSARDGSASAYRAAVVADAPTAYYRFEEPVGSSTVASETDLGVFGTVHGGATRGVPGAIAGDDGHALKLDGASASISFGNEFAFSGGASYTIELWFRADTIDTNYRRIWNRDATNANGRQGYTLYVRTDFGLVAERYIDSQLYSAYDRSFNAPTWTHAVVTYNEATMKLWVDGALVGSMASPANLVGTDSPFVVGSAPEANGFFAGTVDELAIYDRVLTDDRIIEHHRIGAGL